MAIGPGRNAQLLWRLPTLFVKELIRLKPTKYSTGSPHSKETVRLQRDRLAVEPTDKTWSPRGAREGRREREGEREREHH